MEKPGTLPLGLLLIKPRCFVEEECGDEVIERGVPLSTRPQHTGRVYHVDLAGPFGIRPIVRLKNC